MDMASLDKVASDVAGLREQHASDMSIVVDRLTSMEDILNQLLFLTCGHQTSVTKLTGANFHVPRTSNLDRSSVPVPRISNLGRSSVHAAFGGMEMQQTQRALQLQRPLRSLRQVESTSGVEPAPKGLHIVVKHDPVSTSSKPVASALPCYAVNEWDQGKLPTPNLLAGEGASEKMHLLGDTSGNVAGIFSDGGEAGIAIQEQKRSPSAFYQFVWGRLLMPHEKNVWDLFIMLLLLWVCFGAPVVICFGLDLDFWNGHPLGYVWLCVDVAFAMDMYLCFRTAYIDSHGALVTDRKKIAKHYFSHWFIPDLISVLPFNFLFGAWGEFSTLFKMLRVIRIAKIFRLIKSYRSLKVIRLPAFIETLEMSIDKSLINIAIAIFVVVLALHLSACIFYYTAYLGHLSPDTWVGKLQQTGLMAQDAGLWTRYLFSLYWSATTLTTVGYGDITPITASERIVTIPLMLLGVNILGYITSSIANILQVRNSSQQVIDTKRHQVRAFLKERGIPKNLANRIRRFYHYMSLNEVREDEKDIVAELPAKLRSRVLYHMYKDTIEKVAGFKDQHPDLMAMVVSNLKLEYYNKGDIVSCQGDPPVGMYFIGEGHLEVRSYEVNDEQDSTLLLAAASETDLEGWPYVLRGKLSQPATWGQTSSLECLPAPATVVACGFCELFILPTDRLEEVLERFPGAKDLLHPIGQDEALHRAISWSLKDQVDEDSARLLIKADFPTLLSPDAPLSVVAPRVNHTLDRLSRMFHTGGGGTKTVTAQTKEGISRSSSMMFGTAAPSHLKPMTLQRNSIFAAGGGGASGGGATSFSRWPSGLSGKGTSLSEGQTGGGQDPSLRALPIDDPPLGSSPQSPKAVRQTSAITSLGQRSKVYSTSPGDVEMGSRSSSWDNLRSAEGGSMSLPAASSGGRGRRSTVDESSFSSLLHPSVGGLRVIVQHGGVNRASLERPPASPSRLARLSVTAPGQAETPQEEPMEHLKSPSMRVNIGISSDSATGYPDTGSRANRFASPPWRETHTPPDNPRATSGSSGGDLRTAHNLPSKFRDGSSTGRRPLLALSSSGEEENPTRSLEGRQHSLALGSEMSSFATPHTSSASPGPPSQQCAAEPSDRVISSSKARPLTAVGGSSIARRAMGRAMVLSMPPVDDSPPPSASLPLPGVTPTAQVGRRGGIPSPSPGSSNGSESAISKRRALLSQPLSDSD